MGLQMIATANLQKSVLLWTDFMMISLIFLVPCIQITHFYGFLANITQRSGYLYIIKKNKNYNLKWQGLMIDIHKFKIILSPIYTTRHTDIKYGNYIWTNYKQFLNEESLCHRMIIRASKQTIKFSNYNYKLGKFWKLQFMFTWTEVLVNQKRKLPATVLIWIII